MTDEQRKRRNTILAASVGSFLLPLVGVVGTLLFLSRDDREAATALIGATIAGVVFYALVFGIL